VAEVEIGLQFFREGTRLFGGGLLSDHDDQGINEFNGTVIQNRHIETESEARRHSFGGTFLFEMK
jgi:hypothetical protein